MKKVTTKITDETFSMGGLGVDVDVEIGKGAGTKGAWRIGWSYLVGGIVMIYEDGQIIAAKTPRLMEHMTKLRGTE